MLASVGILLNIARSDGVEAAAPVRDRGRRDRRPRDAVARRRARRSAPAACSVSFAGSPDRIEARLVPEAGYEFDPFRISGLPRRPGVAQLRAVLLAGRAPRACARILAARQPGRRVRRRRLRGGADGLRGVEEADPGSADRGGRAPRAGEPDRGAVRADGCFSRTRCAGADGRGTGSSGGPCRRVERVDADGGAARGSDFPPTGRCVLVFGGSQGAAAAERDRAGGLRRRGAGRAPPLRRALPGRADRSGLAGRLPAAAVDGGLRRGARRVRPRAGARRRLGLGGGRRGQAGRARPLAERDRRPPDEERALLRAGRRRRRRAGAGDLRGCPAVVRELLADGARLAAMGEAMRAGCEAGCGGRDRRGADRACLALEGRTNLARRDRRRRSVGIRAAGAGLGRGGRRLGPERDARTSARPRGGDRGARCRRSPESPDGLGGVRLERVSAVSRAGPGPSCSRSSSLRARRSSSPARTARRRPRR